jgi:hypothetical protein
LQKLERVGTEIARACTMGNPSWGHVGIQSKPQAN